MNLLVKCRKCDDTSYKSEQWLNLDGWQQDKKGWLCAVHRHRPIDKWWRLLIVCVSMWAAGLVVAAIARLALVMGWWQ